MTILFFPYGVLSSEFSKTTPYFARTCVIALTKGLRFQFSMKEEKEKRNNSLPAMSDGASVTEITELLIACVNHLEHQVASVLNVNIELQNENNRLLVDLKNSAPQEAHQNMIRLLEELTTKYDDLQAKNGHLEATIETLIANVDLHDNLQAKNCHLEVTLEMFRTMNFQLCNDLQVEHCHLKATLEECSTGVIISLPPALALVIGLTFTDFMSISTIKNFELQEENNQLKTILDTYLIGADFVAISKIGNQQLLDFLEEVAVQKAQLQDQVINLCTLVRALVHSQVH
ncbi:hypothetical protein GYMLUDRAFT_63621 [Collybiopsis luxurians FD-317 M1]|uniref:Uncharacterized protein n=1 Tax=Collybiopsis luxurians FD-317 M1 TaxID=944289 RepID=A0A0D0CFD0_9AGAR|nr:hypothetical protein GYMLUDRAFT_63621 [Collybiopsis luxurians FD-317 M1]